MPMNICDPLYQRLVAQLRNLGARTLGEFLLELTPTTESRTDLLVQLERYSRGSQEMMVAAGGDAFAPRYFYRVDADGTPRPLRRIVGR